MRRYAVAALTGLALLAPAAALALDPASSSGTTAAAPADATDPASPTDPPSTAPPSTDPPSTAPPSTDPPSTAPPSDTPAPLPSDTATPTPGPTPSPSPTKPRGLIVTSGYRLLPSPTHTYVVGDSLTQWGSPELALIRPSWSINGVAGRRVEALPRLVRSILSADAHPRLVVVALGSNPSAGWTRADYARSVAALPAATRVVYVTTYIAPWAPHKAATSKALTRRYTTWMAELAAQRPHTCIAPWNVVARNHEGWLLDGLHETTLGYMMRAQLIVRTSEACR